MDLVRLGFIGLGNITQTRHLPAVSRIPGAQVVAGADINDQLLETVARNVGFAQATDDYGALLANPDVDAVFVNLPTSLHAEVAIAALEAGKHVFCEKPLAMSVAEGRRMVEAAEASGRYLMIGLNQRFATRSVLMKKALDEGRIGRAYYTKAGMLQHNGEPPAASWFARRATAGGGVLIDQGSNLIDLTLWLHGFPDVEDVAGRTGRHVLGDPYDVEDFASVHLRVAGGGSIHIELAWLYNGGPHANLLYTDVFGTEGGARCRARWCADGPPLTIYRRGANDQIVSDIIEFTPQDSHLEQDRHFIDCVRRGIEPSTRPREVLRSMEVIEEVYRQNGLEPLPSSSPN